MTAGVESRLVPWYRFTEISDGDLAASAPGVDLRRRTVLPLPWTWLEQVHGADVVVVDQPGVGAGARADAAVTTQPGAALCVTVADCAPVVLVGDGGVGVVHAGWKGLVAGVLAAATSALRELGAEGVRAEVGPCIGPCCSEFGAEDLEVMTSAFGPTLAGRTREGGLALDLVAGVQAGLAEVDVPLGGARGACTACSPRHWSFRASATACRQALVAGVGPCPS